MDIEALVRQTLTRLRERSVRPESTYRLQFHAGFTFRDAIAVADYLSDLGITHAYASPYLKARPGSGHGYDISDHRTLNPEIGTEAEHACWLDALRQHGLGHILDMVPNHMGIVGNENRWWNDLLENGPSSPYASFFDIDWDSSPRREMRGRVLLPVLGEPYGKVLESGQLRLAYEAGTFTIHYFDHRFPLAPGTYDDLLSHDLDKLEAGLGGDSPALMEYQSILTAIRNLPGRNETEPQRVAERQREKEVIKRRLATLTDDSAPVRDHLRRTVERFNGRARESHTFDLLDRLLARQAYRLAFWRVAADEINYRRFFDVNELAALSMEKPEVFEPTHELILGLLASGRLDGVRIDHPDGLFDPREYLRRLQQHYVYALARYLHACDPEARAEDWLQNEGLLRHHLDAAIALEPDTAASPPLYVVVEKILGKDEALRDDWPVYGSSGYDFLNITNGLFVDPEQAKAVTQVYDQWLGEHLSWPEVVYEKKFLILQVALSSELHVLAQQLDRLAQRDRASRDFTFNTLRHTLREVIACFPVYRSYIRGEPIHPEDEQYVEWAVRRARRRNPAISASVFQFVRDILLLHYSDTATEADRREQRRFVGKFQQVTAPVMAKGVEDTAFYVFNRLLSLNEVGGDPGRFGVSASQAHWFHRQRQMKWPRAFSATATHDTKRGEDVRARLNVLSELSAEWADAAGRWRGLNARLLTEVEEVTVPGPNEEYFIYQTLLGAWPIEPYSPETYRDFIGRIQAYVQKAFHEAKVHTSWVNPYPAYDEAIDRFVGALLDERGNALFLEDFRDFQRRIAHYGAFNSLAQTLLKVASPGVADVYQGTELWDLSLVDPDNRRPVDYARRRELLASLRAEAARSDPRALARRLVDSKNDGRAKLYLLSEALRCRRNHPGLFAEGAYVPAETAGAARGHLFGFVRRLGSIASVVAVPRLLTRLVDFPSAPLGESVWKDTALLLAGIDPGVTLKNAFTGALVTPQPSPEGPTIPAATLFADFPVALLICDLT